MYFRRNRLFPLWVWLVTALTFSSISIAEDQDDDSIQPISQDLLLGESPFVQEEGEIELGFFLDVPDEIDGSKTSTLEFEIEYGVTERLTVAAEIPYLRVENNAFNASGLGDIEVSALYALLYEDELVVSIGVGTALLTGDEEKQLGEGEPEWETSFSVGKLFEDSQLVITASFEFSDDETEQAYTLGWAKQLSQLVFAIDLHAELSEDEEAVLIAPSLLFNLEEIGNLQVGVASGIDSDSPDWQFLAHWYIEFE